ncbi:MAG: nucleotidyl transferase AbiEii/AbiGii toxin family protein [Bacteroidetes bacterium]|nr:nucleotidyl transferase AbiEii/AbiGii toxin family protein [Bacteroidota bacterium]
MIKPGEIQIKAQAQGVRDQQIEKDYILSWILRGLALHKSLSKILVFKGGTVLKKVYFKDYRFSEDLDFTLIHSTISNAQIFDCFREVFTLLKQMANIPLRLISEDVLRPGDVNFFIGYIGPLGGLGSNKKVKVDISRSEVLAFEPVMKPLILGYTDLKAHHILCYTLEEVLVEKLRSIMQRMQARDFYDVWYLLTVFQMDVNQYINEFDLKCRNKGLGSSDFHLKLEQRLAQYKGRWQNSLADQIQQLPSFDMVSREVLRQLKKMKF